MAETGKKQKPQEKAPPQKPPVKGLLSGPAPASKEIGGQEGPDPTRYGDWEKNGRCTDF